ncbi:MAG: ABC transporter permease [Deltaproteobacteria bacterium]|nr:ABC transporter permease [Deltaproteobacteria bacterium]
MFGVSEPFKRFVLVFLFCAAWELFPRLNLLDPLILPPLSKVMKRAFVLLLQGDLLQHIYQSLWRVFAGFLLSVAVAFPLGIFLGLFKKSEKYLEPLFGLFRPLAPPAWIPVAILWFGIGDKPAIFIIFVGTFFSTLTGITMAVRRLDKDLINVAFIFGANLRQTIWFVVIPSLLPSVFAQLRLTLSLSWMCVVAAEMVAVKKGIGFMMMEARNLFRTEDIFVGILVVGLIGLLMDRLLNMVERKTIKWRKGLSAHEFFETG